MGLINRNGTYYALFSDANRQPGERRFSLRTKQKSVARRLLIELEDDWRAGVFDPWRDDPRTYKAAPEPPAALALSEAVDRFLNGKAEAGRSENTVNTYRDVLKLLRRSAGDSTLLTAVRPAHILPVVRDATIAKATRYKRFGHLRSFFRWCLKHTELAADPLADVEKPAKPHKLPKTVTRDELDLICRALETDYRDKRSAGLVNEGEMIWRVPLFRFAFFTGMRASELARLRWRDLDFDKRLVSIYEQKNGKEQTIPLNRSAQEALCGVGRRSGDEYVFCAPGSVKTRERSITRFRENTSRAFREARKAAGIERPVSFHSLRHGFCSALAEAGKPLYIIKEAARHADVSTSLIYVHLANTHLKAELDDVFS